MKKRVLIFVLAALFILSGCTQKAEKNNEGSKTLEEFNIVLDWYPNAVHSFIYEAIDKGYYEEEGLKVNIQFPANANDAISLTAAGKADAGIYYMHDLIMAKVNQDIPIKSVGAVCRTPLNIILSLKEKEIKEPKDLVGKKVGETSNELSRAIVEYMVEKAGEDPEQVEMIDVGFDIMSSMTTGNVDATIGGMVNHEVPQMEESGFEVNYFYPSDYGMPNYYELILIGGEKQMNENPEKMEKFIRASRKGFEEVKKDPESALKLLLENQNAENFPLNENVERKSMEILLPAMENEEGKFLSQSKSVWEENIKWLFENKITNAEIDADEILVEY